VGTVLLALALAGCAGGEPTGSTAAGTAVSPADSQDAAAGAQDGTGSGRYVPAAPSPAALPGDLVGSWSGDDAQGVGSWTIEFGSDGNYREGNTRRGVSITGRAAVAGRRLYLQPDDADSRTVTWQVSGGTLSLDGFTYLRVDSGSGQGGGRALVGTWIGETNAWQTLTFHDDGSYQLDDGTNGLKTGTFSVSGDQVTTGRATYTWSVNGAELQLGVPGGQVATYTRIA
jgi:hypothetical protein